MAELKFLQILEKKNFFWAFSNFQNIFEEYEKNFKNQKKI